MVVETQLVKVVLRYNQSLVSVDEVSQIRISPFLSFSLLESLEHIDVNAYGIWSMLMKLRKYPSLSLSFKSSIRNYFFLHFFFFFGYTSLTCNHKGGSKNTPGILSQNDDQRWWFQISGAGSCRLEEKKEKRERIEKSLLVCTPFKDALLGR